MNKYAREIAQNWLALVASTASLTGLAVANTALRLSLMLEAPGEDDESTEPPSIEIPNWLKELGGMDV